jgi:hypothetical protein
VIATFHWRRRKLWSESRPPAGAGKKERRLQLRREIVEQLRGEALIAVLIWQGVELEGDISAWLAFVFSCGLAGAMAVGIGFHRMRSR